MPTVCPLEEPEGPARATWTVASVSRSRAEATPNKSTLLFDIKGPYRIYHSFFDFDMAVLDNVSNFGQTRTINEVGNMGLMIGDRLAVLMTPKQVTTATGREGAANGEILVDGTRHLQFTVNTVVFALTQEGGVTQQVMAGIK